MQGVNESSLVSSIDFGILDPEVIKKIAVCEITQAKTMENNVYVRGGLSDLRMGTQDPEKTCETCKKNLHECPGHFGYIQLAERFFHYGYLDYVYKILQIVCHKCGRLMCDYSDDKLRFIVKKYKGEDRFKAVYDYLGKKGLECKYKDKKKGNGEDLPKDSTDDKEFWRIVNGCSYGPEERDREPCGNKNKEIKRGEKYSLIQFEDSSEANDYLSGEDAYNILEKMSDQDVRILGFNPERSHPKFMIISVLPVPPLAVRPQVISPGQARPSQDDVTNLLASIIMANNRLKERKQNNDIKNVLDEARTLLQYHLITYMVNDKPSIPRATTKNKRPLKVLSQRLKGKEGHIRGHLSGKRVDFSARSVISPDPSISIDQVGVPKELAKILTFPEVVTRANKEWLTSVVLKGPEGEGGANAIIDDHGNKKDLEFVSDLFQETAALQPGYIVERHLRDDDIVIFNRQPSLHKMSMMGHRAFLMSGKTFRLNLCDTTPYNADFDGDEMNMHVPQSQGARAEVRHIMAVPNQIISPQANKPIIGLVQDALLGCALLSRRDTFLTRNQVMNLMMWLPTDKSCILPPPCILKPQQLWSGKQVFSLFLPKINHDAKSAEAKDDESIISPTDRRVIIRDGTLIAGIIDKRTVARSEQSLIHVVINSWNIETAMHFLNQTQLVVNNWLESRGFSCGIIDCIVPEETLQEFQKDMNELETKVSKLIKSAKKYKEGVTDKNKDKDAFEVLPGLTFMQTFEVDANNLTNKFLSDSSKKLPPIVRKDNGFKEMLMAGSKGAGSNLTQIMALVGQQNMEGKRVKYGFKERTLPHYLKGDYGLVCRGFCPHSYLQGLTPPEFIFHAMAGRTGIIDTACKTSDTGYIQRRLCKSMESHHVAYDGTVRNSMNEVVQFIYGGDGLDPTGLETQSISLAVCSDSEFIKTYVMKPNESTFGQDEMDQQALDDFLFSTDRESKLNEEEERLRNFRDILQNEVFPDGDNTVVLPFNIRRIIQSAQRENNISIHNSKSNLNPIDVIDKVDELANSLIVIRGNDPISVSAQNNATLILRAMIYSNLSAKQVIFKHRLNEKAFNTIIGSIKDRFYRTIVSPGEMVGTIAGQSIGEPSTQMTLNTFHFAGISSHDVTLGVPRLNELMNLAKTIKTPSVTVILDKRIQKDGEKAKEVRSLIEAASFKKFVIKSEIFYDPDPRNTCVDEDTEWLRIFTETSNTDDIQDKLAPWVLRFELDPISMKENELDVSLIVSKIRDFFDDEFYIAYCDETDNKVIRMQSKKNEEAESKYGRSLLIHIEELMYKLLVIKGIKGITRVRIFDDFKCKTLQEDHSFLEEEKINVLYTEGSQFQEILAVDGVDQNHTFTNDVHQIYDVLGVEAARQLLTNEMMAIMKDADASLNLRHLDLLADTMSQYGYLYPASRHGINKTKTGTLMRASFEMTTDVFFAASAFAETDNMKDVSSNVITGRPSPAGTGIVDVFVDENELPFSGALNAEENQLIGPMTPDQPTYTPLPTIGDNDFRNSESVIVSPYSDQLSGADMFSSDIMSPMSPMSPSTNTMSPMINDQPYSPLAYGANTALSPTFASRGDFTRTFSPNFTADQSLNQSTIHHAFSPLSNVQPYSPALCSPSNDFSPANSLSPASPLISRYNPASPMISNPGPSKKKDGNDDNQLYIAK